MSVSSAFAHDLAQVSEAIRSCQLSSENFESYDRDGSNTDKNESNYGFTILKTRMIKLFLKNVRVFSCLCYIFNFQNFADKISSFQKGTLFAPLDLVKNN